MTTALVVRPARPKVRIERLVRFVSWQMGVPVKAAAITALQLLFVAVALAGLAALWVQGVESDSEQRPPPGWMAP